MNLICEPIKILFFVSFAIFPQFTKKSTQKSHKDSSAKVYSISKIIHTNNISSILSLQFI